MKIARILVLLSLIGIGFDAGNAFGEAYVYVGTIGETFVNPLGLAVDASGNVYVADTGNHRVQKFTAGGVYVSTLGVTGVQGMDNGHLNFPGGVTVDRAGNIYVADAGNSRVQKFSSDGVYMNTLGVTGVFGSDNRHLGYPESVAVDVAGNIYVADYGNHRVQKFDADGTYAGTLGTTGVQGSDNNHFGYMSPESVAVDVAGNVYVADSGNYRVQKFSSDGAYVGTLGETGVRGSDSRHFYGPSGVAVDGSGNVYVADSGNYRVQIFDADGAYVGTLGNTVWGVDSAGHFNYPERVAVDASGNVYVADRYSVQMFSPTTAEDKCAATLGPDLSLHVPIADYEGFPFSLDFQWNGEHETLTNATPLTDTSAFDACTHATVSDDLGLHVPEVMYYGISYWLDLVFDGTNFPVSGAGAN